MRKGFTLIELLVVISIIAVLTSLSLSVVTSVRFSAKAAACSSNLRMLVMACLSYAADHENRVDMRQGGSHWGNGGNWALTLWTQGQYLDAKDSFACPDASADGTVSLRTFLKSFPFDDGSFTVCTSYYMHAGSMHYPDEDMAPAGPAADLSRVGGWVKTLAQAGSRDSFLCEWSRVWRPDQEGPATFGPHFSHWKNGRPYMLHVAWFDGHVSKATEPYIYPLYDYWVVNAAAQP